MVNIADPDGNGKVTFADFLAVMAQNVDKQLTDQLTQDQIAEFRQNISFKNLTNIRYNTFMLFQIFYVDMIKSTTFSEI